MGKLIKLLVALTLVFFAFGCGSEEVAEENGNGNENGEVENGEMAEEYEPVAGEPVMEGMIVMEIRTEGEISTYRYATELPADEARIQVMAWAEANNYQIVDENISELILEDFDNSIDTSQINVTITANYEDYDNETLVQIRMFEDGE